MKEYSKLNFKSSYSIGLSLLIVGMTTLTIWLYLETHHFIMLIMSLLLIALILFGIYFGLKSKIIITDQEIISITPFKTKRMNFKDIEKLGIYVASGSSTTDLTVLEEKEKRSWGFLEQKFMYITKNKSNEINLFKKKSKDMIDFHYRKEIYDFIKMKINAST